MFDVISLYSELISRWQIVKMAFTVLENGTIEDLCRILPTSVWFVKVVTTVVLPRGKRALDPPNQSSRRIAAGRTPWRKWLIPPNNLGQFTVTEVGRPLPSTVLMGW